MKILKDIKENKHSDKEIPCSDVGYIKKPGTKMHKASKANRNRDGKSLKKKNRR